MKFLFKISIFFSFVGLSAQISSIQVIQHANEFLNLQWTVTSNNITTGSFHAYNCGDASQKYVVTPDWVNDLSNPDKISVPYKWGGFSTVQDFLSGITNNKLAGDIQTRHPGSNTHYSCGSPAAVGLDCSGFTSRCFELNTHYSTSMMNTNSLFGHYSSYNDIQPGDLANKPGSHVRLVVHVNPNGTLNTIEAGAGANLWRVFAATYSVSSLSQYGYNPQYYVNMSHDGESVPENDSCVQAVNLQSHSGCQSTEATLVGATTSNLPLVSCDNFSGNNSGKDVFFSFVAVNATQTITVHPVSTNINLVVGIYEGNCDNLVEIACANNGGANQQEQIVFNNFMPGNTYYIRVYNYGNEILNQGTFNICVTHNNVGTVFLVYDSKFISDGILGGNGNGNGEINAGEEISMAIKLYNAGSGTAHNLSVTLNSSDPNIQLIQNTVVFPDINSESTALAGNFLFKIDALAVPHTIDFSLDMNCNEGSWTQNFQLNIVGSQTADLRYASNIIHDGINGGIGNYNQTVNPGEQIDLDVLLKNIGLSTAHNVTAVLSCQDSDITITDDQVFWGDILSGETKTGSDFDFTVSSNCPTKTVTFHLLISSDEGAWDQDFEIQVVSSSKIDEFANKKINLYPNPVKQILHIENLTERKIQSIELINLTGKKIYVSDKFVNQINMNSLSKGIYLIRLQFENNESSFYKIIKN